MVGRIVRVVGVSIAILLMGALAVLPHKTHYPPGPGTLDLILKDH